MQTLCDVKQSKSMQKLEDEKIKLFNIFYAVFIYTGGLRRGAGASAALGSLWAAARRGSLQAQPSPAAGGAPRMAGRSLPPARSFSRPRRAAARRWPGSAGNALGVFPGGLQPPATGPPPVHPARPAACMQPAVRAGFGVPLPGRQAAAAGSSSRPHLASYRVLSRRLNSTSSGTFTAHR